MDNKDYPKIRRAAKKQGWQVEPTKHGETFLAPDGRTKVIVHRLHASSDSHALLDEIVRQLRKSGFGGEYETRDGRSTRWVSAT